MPAVTAAPAAALMTSRCRTVMARGTRSRTGFRDGGKHAQLFLHFRRAAGGTGRSGIVAGQQKLGIVAALPAVKSKNRHKSPQVEFSLIHHIIYTLSAGIPIANHPSRKMKTAGRSGNSGRPAVNHGHFTSGRVRSPVRWNRSAAESADPAPAHRPPQSACALPCHPWDES